jgi:hypothetical protein
MTVASIETIQIEFRTFTVGSVADLYRAGSHILIGPFVSDLISWPECSIRVGQVCRDCVKHVVAEGKLPRRPALHRDTNFTSSNPSSSVSTRGGEKNHESNTHIRVIKRMMNSLKQRKCPRLNRPAVGKR